MEDIEYLEEYEDLVLPALNSAAAAAAAADSSASYQTKQNLKSNEDADGSSSSLDQDIFNCLFDDNSDDDIDEYENRDNETALKIKSGSNECFEAIDEIGGKVIEKVEISRQDPTHKFNTIAKTVNKITTTAPKTKTFMTKTSGTTIPLNTRPQTVFVNKTKSVATVRPTVQNQQQQKNLNIKSNLLQRPTSSGKLSFIQRQNPSISSAATSARSVNLPVLVREPLSSATSLPSSSLISKKPAISSTVLEKATIVKPEKIIIKDPAHDPLDLDDLSETASDNDSSSDISGETYNSFSDFEDDESFDEYYSGGEDYSEEEDDEEGISSSSQVIELSNDSSSAPSNLEDFRAPTPSPVISDDSETRSSSLSFKISTIKSIKPYSHPDIIESVLRKGEKPKLLELLDKYNLLEDSVETGEGDNTVIDITTSRENLVESLDTQQAESLTNASPPTTITIDLVNLDLADSNKPLTLNPLNNNQTKSSKKTNKNKSKKKSVINMDATSNCRGLKSPGAISTDSDLSAVEELLEESYAEAMKKVQDVPFTNQDVEAEVDICQGVNTIIQNKQNLPKADVVIDYDAEKGKKIEQNDAAQKEIETEIKEVDQQNKKLNESENLLKIETKDKKENNDVEINELSEQADRSLKQEGIVKKNPENVPDKDLKSTGVEYQETSKIVESAETSIFSSPNAKKKKRFRNLLTPEPSTSETAMSIDDMKDFKGFEEEEEVKSGKRIEKTEKLKKNTQSAEETPEKTLENIAEKDRPAESFKSPSSSHQSVKDKSRESKGNSSRDDSKESKDKSSRYSKSSRDSSKDRSSRESSRDKSSRESSKDRSRESSKDRSKHSHNKDSASKHHHREHRKSSDSKDSSKSRESSKSRDSKETKNIKTATQDSQKSTSIKRNLSSDSIKEKSTEEKDKKTNETDKRAKETVKSSTETKITKEQDNKKGLKEFKKSSSDSSKSGDSKETKNIKTVAPDSHKSSSIKRDLSLDSNKEKSTEKKDNHIKEIVKSTTESKITKVQDNKKEVKELQSSSEKKDKRSAETSQKPKEKDSGKTLTTSSKESKDINKYSSSSTKTDSTVIRDSSKEHKNMKTIDLTKSSSETKKPDHSKSPKVSTNLNKSLTNRPSTSATAGNVKLSKTNEKPTQDSKGLKDIQNSNKTLQKSNVPAEESKFLTKITKSASDKSLNLKDTPEKKPIQNPKTSSTNLNTSKTSSKTVEGDKKYPQQNVRIPSSDSKINKMDDQSKKNVVDVNKTSNEKQQSNKISTKSDVPSKTKNQTPVKQAPKETVSTGSIAKHAEVSSTKTSNAETKNKNVKPTSFNVQKPKTIAKSDEIKSKEKSSDFKKPKETLKTSKETEQAKTIEIKNKDTHKISMSPKISPKPKEETIKKSDAANVINATKTTQQADSKNLSEVAAQNSEKIKADKMKTKSDGNKIKDSKNTVDSITGSEKCKTNAEKKEVAKTKNDGNETNKTFTSAKKEASADNEQAKETKIKKDQLKDTSLKTVEENDNEIEKRDAQKNASLESDAEKNIVPEIPNKEQKGKETEKNKIPETPNKDQKEKETPKPTFPETPSKEEKSIEIETNKISQTPNKEQKGKDTEKNKVPQSLNKEQTGKAIEKTKISITPNKEQKGKETKINKVPQTSNKEQKGKDTEENKIQETLNKEQKEKDTEKDKISETSNKEQKGKESEKNKVPQTPIKEQKQKEIKKNKISDAPNKEQKSKEAEKDNISETSNKEQKGKDSEKNKIPQTPIEEQKEKETEKNKTPHAPNKEQKAKEAEKDKISETSNKEQKGKRSEKNKVSQTPIKEQKEKEIEKNKIPGALDKEQKANEAEKNKIPETPNKEQKGKDTEKNKVAQTPNKEQKVKVTEKVPQTPPNNEQKGKETEKAKVPQTSNKEQKGNDIEKNKDPKTANKEQKGKVMDKNKILETCNKEEKEQKIGTIEKNDASKSENSHEQNTKKPKVQINTNKDNLNEHKTTKIVEVSTNKSVSSLKTFKNTQKQVATKSEDQTKSLKTKEQITKPQDISQEMKIEAIATVHEIKIETEKLQDSCIEPILNPGSNQDETINVSLKPCKLQDSIKDSEMNDVVMVDAKQEQIKISKHNENLNEETKQIEGNVKLSSDKNLEEVEAAQPSEIILKVREKPVLRKSIKDDAAKESEKIRSIMESVLEKSVVIVIEPLKSKPAVEPRMTRSRMENPKLNDSIKKEEPSKDEILENTATRKVETCSESSTLEKMFENENDKMESEHHNEETLETRKNMKLTADAKKADICQAKEPTLLEDEKSIADDCRKDIDKEIVEPIKTQSDTEKPLESKKIKQRADNKGETEREETETSQVGLSDEKIIIQKEMEEENLDPIKIRSQDREAEVRKEKCEIFQAESCEEKCSTPKEEKEPSETVVKGNSRVKTTLERSLETLSEKGLAKIESKDDNIEQTKTRTSVDLKKEAEKGESSEIESSAEMKSAQEEQIKTRKREDLKTEAEKEKIKLTQVELSNEKTSAKPENEPVKTRRRGDLKEEATKGKTELLEVESSHLKCSAQKELKEEHSESIRTRRRGDLKADKEKTERTQVELSVEKSSRKEENEPVKTRRRGDLKEESVKEKLEILQVEQLESVKTRSRGDLKAEADKEQTELLEEKSSTKKENEPVKTRRRGDIKQETGKQKPEILQVGSLDDKCSTQNEMKVEHLESGKTRRRGDLKAEADEEKIETTRAELSAEKISAKKENEPMKTRRGGDLKEEAEKEILQVDLLDDESSAQNELKEYSESIKTRRHGDIKAQGDKEIPETTQVELSDKKSSAKKEIKPIKQGAVKEKTEILQLDLLDVESSAQNELKEHSESVKTRRRGDIKVQADKEEPETTQLELSDEKSSAKKENEPIKTRRGGDLKEDAVKEKTEILQVDLFDAKNELKEHSESVKTRRRGDIKAQPDKEKPETTQVELSDEKSSTKKENESVKTRRRGDFKEEAVKEKTEILQVDLLDDESSVVRTRRRGDIKVQADKEKTETTQVEFSDEKSSTKNENEQVKTRGRGDLTEEIVKEKLEILQVGLLDDKCSTQKELKEDHLESTKTKKRGDLKADADKEKAKIMQVESSEEKSSTKKENQPIKTRARSDLKEVAVKTEILKNDALDDKCSAQQELKEDHLESIKTRKRGDLKADADKEKVKIMQVESSEEKSSTKKENQPVKTRARGDLKEEAVKEKPEILKVDALGDKCSAEKELQEKMESVKTRRRVDLKAEDDKETTQIAPVELSEENSSAKKEHESIKARRRGDLKESAVKEKTEILQVDSLDDKCSSQKESKEEHLESVKTRRRGDLKAEADKEKTKITQVELSEEKSSTKKENEPVKTKRRGDLKEKSELLKVDSLDDKCSAQSELKEEHVESVKTRTRDDKEKTEIMQSELPDEKSSAENENEPIKTSSRGDLKVEAVKEKTEILQVDSLDDKCSAQNEPKQEHLESVKTRRRGDLKAEDDKEKTKVMKCEISAEKSSTKKENDPVKTRRSQILKVDLLDDKSSSQKELEAEHLEPPKTRKRVDLKTEAEIDDPQKLRVEPSDGKISIQKESGKERSTPVKTKGALKEKMEISQLESSNKTSSAQESTEESITEPIMTRKRGNPKGEAVKGKSEITQLELSDEKSSAKKNTEAIITDPITTRRHADPKADAGKYQKETSQVAKEAITTRRRGDTKADHGKDELSKVESSEEKCLVQDNLEEHFEPRRTRSQLDLKGDTENEKDEISPKDLSLDTIVKNTSGNTNKNIREENDEPIEIRSGKDGKEDTVQIPQDDSQHPTGEKCVDPIQTRSRGEYVKQPVTHSDGNDKFNILQDEKEVSTADEKKSEEMNSNESKQLQSSTTLEIISETEKKSEESVVSENEMSSCESSSSNSDNTFRRNLRKRASDSPLTENDNKKTFKEPLLKSATPKSAKNEKAITNVLSSSSKRPLRSPAAEAESPSSSKKPKLEISKKSRFRNLHDDCFEKIELPIVTVQTTSKEQPYLLEQAALLDKQKLNESSTIVHKTSQKKNTKEFKETCKNTAVLEKKVEEKAKDDKPSPQADKSKEEEKVESETNVPDLKIQLKTYKANVKTSPNKSPSASAVISFSDWLKTKNQNNTTEVTNESVTTKENTPNILKRQSRERARITSKIVEPKLTEDKEKTVEIDKASQAETTIICQDKAEVSALEDSQENSSALEKASTSGVIGDDRTLEESMDISQQLDNSLLQLSATQVQNDIKQQNVNRTRTNKNVKRLQTSTKVSKKSSKIQTSPTKSSTPTTTSPRIRKSETALLIASMPKEMKDRGITDLLKAEASVKRRRLPNRRIISDITKQRINTSAITTRATQEGTLSPSVVQLSNVHTSALMLSKEIPKVPDISENLYAQTTISISKNMSKSPTRRKPQQSVAISRKSFTVSQKGSSRRDSTNIPDLTACIEQAGIQEDPKALATKSRRSLNIKDLPRQMETGTTDTARSGVVRSRKSMPLLSKESLGKDSNVPSIKSLAISKQQSAKEQIALPESNVFKTPKQAGPSAILNKIPIPSAASIKKLYAADIKRPESRIKVQQKENVLNKFKCRKPYVRLDRSIVENYLKSISNKKKLARKQTSLRSVFDVPATSADISSIIHNNSETSLRIQSVVDGSAIPNTLSPVIMTDAQVRSTNTLQGAIPTIEPPYILPGVRGTSAVITTPIVNAADTNEIIELKHEFMDENPIGLINDEILPDTPTLLARAQTITKAAQHALSNSVTPTDIRLLTTDSSQNNFVPSFGVTPTTLDNKGTCLYTFLHPEKYYRNHSNVLLDYCCPNLDGPMPAIDPTRIHAQVQVPVIELPASIVLTTKVVTRADLENGTSSIPAIIRKKAEKIRKNMATHHKLAVTTTAANTQVTPIVPSMTQPHLAPAPIPSLPPTINALTKQLPSTTTITAKIRPSISQQSQQILLNQPAPSSIVVSSVASSLPKNTTVSVIHKGHSSQLSDTQQAILRSNLRRFDVLLKQLVQPYESLSFVERHRIIESVIASGSCLPKDLDHTLIVMEEYIKQTMLLKRNDSLKQPPASSTSAIVSTNNYTTSQASVTSPLPTAQMPQLQPSPKILASNAVPTTANTFSAQFEKMHNKVVKKVQSRGKNTSSTSVTTGSPSSGVLVKQRQVPIYDTDRNIIGYQMQMMTPMSTMPAYTKSTMSTNSSGIMSTSLDSSSNKITAYCISKRPIKRPAQDSPRVFYTTPPLQTSTPKGITNADMYPTQHSTNANTIAHKTQGSIVTTVRSGGSSSSANSETITTTTTATVKRVTRSTATGSKIIILSKSNQSSEETILPDASNTQQQTEQQPEIKNENDIEDFLG